MIRTAILCLALTFISHLGTAQAQDDIVRLRAVCAKIKANLGSLRKVTASSQENEKTVALEGWLEGKDLRRIVATVPGERGVGVEEYYLENGRLLFFYSVYDTHQSESGRVVTRTEDRGYFKNGEMFKWLADEEKSIPVDSDEFKAKAAEVTKSLTKFKAALSKGKETAG